jgi:hypothetical protein
MAARSIPAILLGPKVNLQGTYKFLNLAAGKKSQTPSFHGIPNARFDCKEGQRHGPTGRSGALDFADRNGVLFEWNDDVDKNQEGIVKEDTIPYPSVVAKFPGVILNRNHPVPSIEDKYHLKAVRRTQRLETQTSHP